VGGVGERGDREKRKLWGNGGQVRESLRDARGIVEKKHERDGDRDEGEGHGGGGFRNPPFRHGAVRSS
jgi:hypothetical protein